MKPVKGSAHRALLEDFIASMSAEDALYIIFNFIKNHLLPQQIICFSAERSKQFVNIFIDYSINGFTNIYYSNRVKYFVPWELIMESYINKNSNFVIMNDVQKLPDFKKQFTGNPFEYRSSLAITLHIDEKEDRSFTMLLMHAEPNVFKSEHRQFLMPLYSILQKLTLPFFRNKAEPHLTLTAEGPLPHSSEALLRNCPGLELVMRQVDAIAPTSCTVLINGPTGSGKELVAGTLHSLSRRKNEPFIKVNCGAIPETLIESEFFGFEKGAFTGATSARTGYFEQAHGGTLYLDEVGELSKNAQTRLLRVLETQEIQRVGGSRCIKLDVRIIAATNRDLWELVREGQFREDLCYRLYVFPLFIPALRNRAKDIPILMDYFYKYYVQSMGLNNPPALHQHAVRRLAECPWPGNVRQLRYTMERELLMSIATQAKELLFDNLEGAQPQAVSKHIRSILGPETAAQIRQALSFSSGRIQGPGGAAERLGLHPATLRSRMRSLGIPLPRQHKAQAKRG